MERALFAVSLPGQGTVVRRPDPVSGPEPRSWICGGSGLLVACLEGLGPGPVDRLAVRDTGEEPRQGGEQQPVSDPAASAGSPSGLASSGADASPSARRLGASLRRPTGAGRDLRRPGAVFRDVLPGGELCGDRPDGGVGAKGSGDDGQDGLGLSACRRLPGEAPGGTGPGVSSVASGLLRLDGGGVRGRGSGRRQACRPVPDSGERLLCPAAGLDPPGLRGETGRKPKRPTASSTTKGRHWRFFSNRIKRPRSNG